MVGMFWVDSIWVMSIQVLMKWALSRPPVPTMPRMASPMGRLANTASIESGRRCAANSELIAM